MREIKYKAVYDGQLYNFVELTSHKDGSLGVQVGEGYSNMFTPKHENKLHLLQYTGFNSEWFAWETTTDEETNIYENQIIEVTFLNDILPTMCYVCMSKGRWICKSLKEEGKQESLFRVLNHLEYSLHKTHEIVED